MIILRTKRFSFQSGKMIEKVVEKLDKAGVEDYEIVKKIPIDVISVTLDLNSVKIYIPRDYEYSQYDIDDFIRDLIPYARTRTVYDRNIYVMTVSTSMKVEQFCKLVQFIADEWEFCSIIMNND